MFERSIEFLKYNRNANRLKEEISFFFQNKQFDCYSVCISNKPL